MDRTAWREAFTADGKKYYHNLHTKETQWEPPPEPPTPRMKPSSAAALARIKEGRRTPRIFHLFSGPVDRPDGVADYCQRQGIVCHEFDIRNADDQDVLLPANRAFILQNIRDGYVQAAIIGTPHAHTVLDLDV